MIPINLINETNIYKICHLSELDQDATQQAIKKINESVSWSRYDDTIFKNYYKENQIFFALHISGDSQQEIAGYVTLSERIDHNYIPFIAVDAKNHSGKAGSHLMKAAVEKTKEIGIKTLRLHFRDKEKLTNFYTRVAQDNHLSFEITSDGYYLNGELRKKVSYFLNEPSKKEEVFNEKTN